MVISAELTYDGGHRPAPESLEFRSEELRQGGAEGTNMKRANRSETRTKRYPSKAERSIRDEFLELFENCPIPKDELLLNLGLFIKRQDLSRILFMHELYKKIIDVQGVIIEFGVRWGQNLALFEAFRAMYEPYNHTRKIIGFDTFRGFPSLHSKDGGALAVGDYSVSQGYADYLRKVLDYHE